ncbi:MAG: hypothetical protein LBJ46_11070 [Planctomycetota bacterium]|jgi:hypothetical protein|nr:hypothetical protein [Planctomycetota bacterium]
MIKNRCKVGRIVAALAVVLCLHCLSGCLGRFAANQGRRQAARSADYYVRNYAEPEVGEYYAHDSEAQREMRRARNDIADTIVRSGNPRQQTRVGVDDGGWLTDEGY